MSKNQYIELEKDDILFVNNGKNDVSLFIFDGKDLQRMVTAGESEEEPTVTIELDTKSLVGNINDFMADEVKRNMRVTY